MLALMNKAFEPSLSYADKIMFMTSVKYLETIRSESTQTVVDKIKDLITSKNTRLQGLQFLEIALNQNSEIYIKGRWTTVLFEILKEPVSSILKEHACKIYSMLIPFMAKDALANTAELQKFASVLFPFLITEVENNVEWIESAGICLCTCLKLFPQALEPHRDRMLHAIFQQISHNVSSRSFEVFAECFCFVQNCLRQDDPSVYVENWTNHYLTTLNTMHYILNTFLPKSAEDQFATNTSVPDIGLFPFVLEDEDDDTYPAYMKGARRFINMSKCLAKMLSTSTKFSVQVPVKLTLECISRLFQIQDMAEISPTSFEMQIVISVLPQLQIAALVILESLILNFNIVPYSCLISQMMVYALQASSLPNLTQESCVWPLRHAVWKLLDKWLSVNGAKVTSDLVSEESSIIEEFLKDISVENPPAQATDMIEKPSTSKSKKNMPLNSERKTSVNKSQRAVCREALKTIENILYSGPCFISKKVLQEVFAKIVQVAYAIIPQREYPFPYDDAACRKQLYSVLLAIAVVTKTDQREPIQCATGIFKTALLDPSTKVVRLCHKAMAMCRLYQHPKKPIPIIKDCDDKSKRVLNAAAGASFNRWETEEFVKNLPPVGGVTNEDIKPIIAQPPQNLNESEMADDYMHVDAHYSEQEAEGQCNGENLLDIPNSSQCQDDVDSDEEDEEEEDEHSYGEEEMNQEIEDQAEDLYIPSTSKMQVLNSAPDVPETEQNEDAQDYEELRPCGKNEDSNKNVHLNGVRDEGMEEEMSSPSVQNIASENGVYDGFEEEELEEEEVDEEEEEESGSYPAEKRIPEYLEAPAKRQKLDEVNEEADESKESLRSPTLAEMKADFCCSELEDVKS